MRLPRLSALPLLLATVLAPSAHAGAAGQLNSSEASVLVTSMIVVSVPLAASVGLSELAREPFKASARNGKAPPRTQAVPLPPMEVKQVRTTATGEHQVQLQVPDQPDQPDQTATLQWPAQAGGPPATGFVVGQQVRFQPTPAGAGWTVTSPQGQALAYVPTAYAAGDVLSETL